MSYIFMNNTQIYTYIYICYATYSKSGGRNESFARRTCLLLPPCYDERSFSLQSFSFEKTEAEAGT